MIRPAVPADLEDIVALGVEFGNLTKSEHTFPVSESKIREVAKQAIVDNGFIMLVFVDYNSTVIKGVAFAYILKPFFSDEVVCQEMALYCRRPLGIPSLLKGLEKEAKVRGATKVVVGSKPDYCNLDNFYRRMGYSFMENQFIKKVV